MAVKREDRRVVHSGSVVGSIEDDSATELIAAPNDDEVIQINEMTFQSNNDGNVSVSMRTSDSTVRAFRFANNGDGFSQVYPENRPHPWVDGESVNATCTEADDGDIDVSYFIQYDIIHKDDDLSALTPLAD